MCCEVFGYESEALRQVLDGRRLGFLRGFRVEQRPEVFMNLGVDVSQPLLQTV